jgi:hypothetical protein
MRILISNDDGVMAPGIAALHGALQDYAECTIVAPTEDKSGASSSLTLDRPLHPATMPNGYIGLNGTPTDCVHRDTFFTTGKTELLGGGGLDVDRVQRHLQVLGDQTAHGLDVRRHLRRLGDDGGVDIADHIALGVDQTQHMAQQRTAVGTFEGRIGVGEVLADITQRAGAEQRIAQGMQQHVAIGVGHQAEPVRDAHTAESDEIALAEAMNVVAVTDTHRKTP